MSIIEKTVNTAPPKFNPRDNSPSKIQDEKLIEGEQYKKISYRQKGRMYSGQIVKGTSSAAFIKKGMSPVIPEKLEKMAYMDSNKKGFGSNSMRFAESKSYNEFLKDPGPGQYLNENNLNQMLRKSESYSRKGLGNGFISKVDRFKNNDFFIKSPFPGPGSYTASTHAESLISQSQQTKLSEKYKNQNLNAVFMAHLNKSKHKKQITPGPGFYQVEKSLDSNIIKGESASSQAAFRSNSNKCDYINWNRDLLQNPCPGQYQFERNNLLRKTVETFNDKRHTSSFMNPLNCKRVKVNLYDPFQKPKTDVKGTPAPGFYNVEKDSIAYKNLEKMTSGMFSSVFQRPSNSSPSKQANQLKTSQSLAQLLPGPGYYDPGLKQSAEKEKLPVGSSMFKSDSVRELAMVKRGPGPAFYKNPSAPDQKRQFNFNPSKQWL